MSMVQSSACGGCLGEKRSGMASETNHPFDLPDLTAMMSRGDEGAFHEFHRCYFDRLFCYLLVIAKGDEELAREALQLTFVRVARHVRRFESETVFWSWLTVLARSSFSDENRKRYRYQGLLARFVESRDEASSVTNVDAGTQFSELLSEELERLPVDDRELLDKKYREGESVRCLAESRRMSEKAMESHLLRIRRKLKTAMLSRLK
jgi:RNA polymerase sigma factor (sigma-70 family)